MAKKTKLQKPPDAVIDELGVRPLARNLGVSTSTIYYWQRDGHVPSRHHQAIIKLGAGKVTMEDLIYGRTVRS